MSKDATSRHASTGDGPVARPLRFHWRIRSPVVPGSNMFGKYLSEGAARRPPSAVLDPRNLFKYLFKYGTGLVSF